MKRDTPFERILRFLGHEDPQSEAGQDMIRRAKAATAGHADSCVPPRPSCCRLGATERLREYMCIPAPAPTPAHMSTPTPTTAPTQTHYTANPQAHITRKPCTHVDCQTFKYHWLARYFAAASTCRRTSIVIAMTLLFTAHHSHFLWHCILCRYLGNRFKPDERAQLIKMFGAAGRSGLEQFGYDIEAWGRKIPSMQADGFNGASIS